MALLVLVLPQLPMTIGNAIIANADLSKEYFGEDSKKVTYKSTTLSMAFANGLSFLLAASRFAMARVAWLPTTALGPEPAAQMLLSAPFSWPWPCFLDRTPWC